MKLIHFIWIPLLSVASMVGPQFGKLFNALCEFLTFENRLTLLLAGIITFFFIMAIKANQKRNGI